MKRTFTCIICPNGCEIDATYEGTNVTEIRGNLCKKGIDYVTQELVNPMRTIATSVAVKNGTMPLASVRLTKPIPKGRIFDAMEAINRLSPEAPVSIGQVLIADLFGTGSDVIVTKNVAKTK